MSESKEKEELEKYISKEGLTDTYPLLILQIKLCETRIFIRDMDKDKIKYTYILPTDIETLNYYEKVGNDLSAVFSFLLDCHVHSIQNCGRAFLIPDIHFASNEKENRWQEIVRKVNRITAISPITLRINVKETVSQRMLENPAL